VATIHPGATLTPHFRDFLPPWLDRQTWYRGGGERPVPVGFFRFEDPAGEVGIETHLVASGSVVHQVPMTYRGAPLDGAALIATAEHSVLGTRWIYDAETDPVWRAQLLATVRAEGRSEASKRGVGPCEARGRLLRAWDDDSSVEIELVRVLSPGPPPTGPDVLGVLTADWTVPDGDAAAVVEGCLAVVRTHE
jgi:hypothetical protein